MFTRESLIQLLGFGKAPEHWDFFRRGGVLGIGITIVVIVGVRWICRLRRRLREIRVPGEGGNLYVSLAALKDFIGRILADFREVELVGIKLQGRPAALVLTIEIDALPDASLAALRESIKNRVRQDLREKMGIDKILKAVDIRAKRHNADEAKIARQARKLNSRDTALAPIDEESDELQLQINPGAD